MIGFLYNWIQASWEVSTVLVKYILVCFIAYELYRRSNIEDFRADLNSYSYYLVGIIVLIALPVSITGVKITPMIPFIGEFVALIFYAYLFWEY